MFININFVALKKIMSEPITLTNKKVNKDDFVKEILHDYKIICLSREASLLGKKEVLTAKQNLEFLAMEKLAQLVIKKFFKR